MISLRGFTIHLPLRMLVTESNWYCSNNALAGWKYTNLSPLCWGYKPGSRSRWLGHLRACSNAICEFELNIVEITTGGSQQQLSPSVMSRRELTILLMPVWVRDRMLEVITVINGFTKRQHCGFSATLLFHRILGFSENLIFSSDVHIQNIYIYIERYSKDKA